MCRAERRFSFRNERKLFKVKDAFTGKEIFSLYPMESGRKVITQEEWHGDSWDAMEYACDYDFSKNFFVQFFELLKEVPIFNQNVEFTVNSPYSGNATGLKNCYLCFISNYSEDCMYCSDVNYSKDCIDDCHVNHSERCYESFWLQKCYQCYFTIMSVESSNLWFCRDCLGCNDCLGCTNLRKSSYCIFNKQYTKEEYFKTVEKIKKHMDEMPYVDKKGSVYKYGEFFPIEFSSFGYNNTIAIQHFDMTEEKAKENGYPWFEIPRGEYKITKKASELPDSINDVNEDVLKEVIECEKCKNAYRVLENELSFYKKENLPIPTMCNECRYERRISDRLKINLYERKCMCAGDTDETGVYKNTAKHSHGDEPCGEEFKTGYSPEGKEIVYCEKCYQQEVY